MPTLTTNEAGHTWVHYESDEDLADHIEALEEQLGELEGQHRSETAMYGDSWPGAQVQISELATELGELQATWEATHEPAPDVDDIPF